MQRLIPRLTQRLGVALAGALALAVAAILAGLAGAGPLDPSGAPSSTDSVRLPGTPISSAPVTLTQPGHYYLTRNLSVSGVTAITVSSPDVTIDLGGFTLAGNDSPNTSGVDMNVGGPARAEVYNGTVRDFDVGIDAGAAGTRSRIHDVILASNVVGANLGAGSVLADCTSTKNTHGVYVIDVQTEIRRCNINQNIVTGITVFPGANSGLIERNSLFGNNTQSDPFGAGILLLANTLTVRENEFGSNAEYDVNVNGHNSVFIDNVLDCPGSIVPNGGTGNYIPSNNGDPHTNRAHRPSC